MSEHIDLDFFPDAEPSFGLMRLAFKTGWAIGEHLGREFDNQTDRTPDFKRRRVTINYSNLDKPKFDYGNL